jgi:hypothetical protein
MNQFIGNGNIYVFDPVSQFSFSANFIILDTYFKHTIYSYWELAEMSSSDHTDHTKINIFHRRILSSYMKHCVAKQKFNLFRKHTVSQDLK